jgi:uncharacterized repeat protein (TIGR03803 family)
LRRVSLIFLAVALVSCSSTTVPSVLLPSDRASDARPLAAGGDGYKTLHIFKGKPDGSNPAAPLVGVSGTLYGTTLAAGANGFGTIFTIAPSGKESVLYSFAGSPDGSTPSAGLLALNGTFYGTTSAGGANNHGTVFEINASGAESVLYSFAGGTDGAHPVAPVISMNGTLYGTTPIGGNGHSCCGTVFSVSSSNHETVVHRFQGTIHDGAEPIGGLVALHGELYGTTEYGGARHRGTVFAVSPSGKERIVYSFKGFPSDGAQPVAGLVAVNGKLYGTTDFGGDSKNCGPLGCGAVFEVSTSGAEKVLHSFEGGSDGSAPPALLIAVGSTLYGTTSTDGNLGCRGGEGCGTVFEVSTSGSEKTLYVFKGGPRGSALPEAGVYDFNGALYGTTLGGGSLGDGTVFKVLP